MSRIAKLSAVVAVLALAAGPLSANAGTYRLGYDVIRGVEFKGSGLTFTSPMTVTLNVEEAQSGALTGQFRAVPTPTAPDAGEAQPAPPAATGCIVVKIGGITDRGCRLTNTYVAIDPAFTAAQVVLTYRSSVFDGADIRVILSLAGTGSLAPATEGRDPSVEGDVASTDSRIVLTRPATSQGGTVTSDGIGQTATILATESGRMFSGLALDALLDRSCMIALGGVCQG